MPGRSDVQKSNPRGTIFVFLFSLPRFARAFFALPAVFLRLGGYSDVFLDSHGHSFGIRIILIQSISSASSNVMATPLIAPLPAMGNDGVKLNEIVETDETFVDSKGDQSTRAARQVPLWP